MAAGCGGCGGSGIAVAGGGGGGGGTTAAAAAFDDDGPGAYVMGGLAIELRVPLSLLCCPTSVSASDSVVSHRGGASASEMGAATLVSTIGSDGMLLSAGGCRCGWTSCCCSRCSRCCRAESNADCQGLLEWLLECEADLCFPSRGVPRTPMGDCLPAASRDDDGSVDVEGRP